MSIGPPTSAPDNPKLAARNVGLDPTERAIADLAVAFWGRWWAWCLAWGAVFAAAVWLGVLVISAQNPMDGAPGSTSNLIDAAAFPLVELGVLVLLIASAATGFRLTFERRWLRSTALWAVTSFGAAALGVVLARPLMRPRLEPDWTRDPGWTITITVAKQLHQIPAHLAWMFGAALIPAVVGIVIGLVVRLIRRRTAR